MMRRLIFSGVLVVIALAMGPQLVSAQDIDDQHRTDSRHWLVKGKEFLEHGELNRAKQALEISLMLDPGNFKARSLVQKIDEKQMGEIKSLPDEKTVDFGTVKRLDQADHEKSTEPENAREWFERGREFYDEGNLEKSQKCLQIAIELDEKNFEIRRLLGTVSAKLAAAQVPVKRIPPPGTVFPYVQKPVVEFADKRIIEERIGEHGVKERIVVVRPGDTLSSLTARFMGDPLLFRKLADYNNLKDPNMLKPGDVIKVPVLGKHDLLGESGLSSASSGAASAPDMENIFPPEVTKPIGEGLPNNVLDSISSIPGLKPVSKVESVKPLLPKSMVEKAAVDAPGVPEFKKTEIAVTPDAGDKVTMDDLSFLKNKPATAADYFKRSQILWKLGKLEEAMESYKRAIQADPRYLARKEGDRLVERAITHLATRVPKYRRTSAEMRYALASIYHRSGRYLEAVEEYKAAIERDPEYQEAYFNLGLVYEKMNALDQAVETYEKVNEIFSTSPSMVNLATERIMQLVEWEEGSR